MEHLSHHVALGMALLLDRRAYLPARPHHQNLLHPNPTPLQQLCEVFENHRVRPSWRRFVHQLLCLD